MTLTNRFQRPKIESESSAPDESPPREEWAAFKVEQRGIELIPADGRASNALDLFGMWSGSIWNVEVLLYGSLLASFGLSFTQCVLAILVGNLSWLLVGLASFQGPETGTTSFMISRATFGVNGNKPVGFFNWVTMVGYEVLTLYLGVVIGLYLVGEKNLYAAPAILKVVFILLACALLILLPYFGHATITKVLKNIVFVFVAVYVVMTVLVLHRAHLGHMHSGSFAVWTTAVALVVAGGGLGWTNEANDFSRYLPKDTPRARIFVASSVGGMVPAVLLEILGAAVYSISTKAIAVTGLPTAFPSWFETPFLLLAIVQIFCITALGVYSSGVTLQAIGVPVRRNGAVVIDTVVAGAVTALVVFKGNLYTDLSGFLLYTIVWIAPWFGIVVVDWALRRGRYHAESLVARSGGTYWRNGGFHWPALIAQGVGMAAALMWLNAAFAVPSWIGPISSHLGDSDVSWGMGTVVGGVVYYLVARRGVRAEASEMGLLSLQITQERLDGELIEKDLELD